MSSIRVLVLHDGKDSKVLHGVDLKGLDVSSLKVPHQFIRSKPEDAEKRKQADEEPLGNTLHTILTPGWVLQAKNLRREVLGSTVVITIGTYVSWLAFSGFGRNPIVNRKELKAPTFREIIVECGSMFQTIPIYALPLRIEPSQHQMMLQNTINLITNNPFYPFETPPKPPVLPIALKPFIYENNERGKWIIFNVQPTFDKKKMQIMWVDEHGESTLTFHDPVSYSLVVSFTSVDNFFNAERYLPGTSFSDADDTSLFGYQNSKHQQGYKKKITFASYQQMDTFVKFKLGEETKKTHGERLSEDKGCAFWSHGSSEVEQFLFKSNLSTDRLYTLRNDTPVDVGEVDYSRFEFQYAVVLAEIEITNINTVRIRRIHVHLNNKMVVFDDIFDFYQRWLNLPVSYVVTIDDGCRTLNYIQEALQEACPLNGDGYCLIRSNQMLIDLAALQNNPLMKKKWPTINWIEEVAKLTDGPKVEALFRAIYEIGEITETIQLYHELASFCKFIPPAQIVQSGEQAKFMALWLGSTITRRYAFPILRTKTESFSGGWNVQPKIVQVWTNVVDIDVSSAYPSEVIRNSLCPSTHSEEHGTIIRTTNAPGIIPILLKSLLTKRNAAKQHAPKGIKQLVLKLSANAAYGGLSNFFPAWGQAVTNSCKALLKSVVDQLEIRGQTIISVDTDGFLMATNESDSIAAINLIVKNLVPDGITISVSKAYQQIAVFNSKKWAWYSPLEGKGMDWNKRGVPSLFRQLEKELTETVFQKLQYTGGFDFEKRIQHYAHMLLNAKPAQLIVQVEVNSQETKEYWLHQSCIASHGNLSLTDRLNYLFVIDPFTHKESIACEHEDFEFYKINKKKYFTRWLVPILSNILRLMFSLPEQEKLLAYIHSPAYQKLLE
jgi:hypothetical protein